MHGLEGADQLYGGDGDDRLYGLWGDDVLYGGNGNDFLYGQGDNDTLYGEAGNDWLHGGTGNDTMYGGVGHDQFRGEAGNDVMRGGDCNDTFDNGSGFDKMYGEAGNDTFHSRERGASGSGDARIDGGSGYDTLTVYNQHSMDDALTSIEIWGNTGTIKVGYGEGDPTVGTFTGVERLNVRDGTSYKSHLQYIQDEASTMSLTVEGTTQNDVSYAGSGNETLMGGGGNDSFYVGRGGQDLVISATNDSDFIRVIGDKGLTTVRGFTGAGVEGGDRLVFHEGLMARAVESNGKTTFYVGPSSDMLRPSLVVEAVGLKQGIDYFFEP